MEIPDALADSSSLDVPLIRLTIPAAALSASGSKGMILSTPQGHPFVTPQIYIFSNEAPNFFLFFIRFKAIRFSVVAWFIVLVVVSMVIFLSSVISV